MDQTTAWRPDPYGAHELRFFSADGNPTLLVMDGGKTSYDRPPRAEPAPHLEPLPRSEPESDPDATAVLRVVFAPPARVVDADDVAPRSSTRTNQHGIKDSAVAGDQPRETIPEVTDFADGPSATAVERLPEAQSHKLKIAHVIVFVVLVLSALGLVYVHLHHTGGRHLTRSEGSTTSSSPPRTTTTTFAVPTALQTAPEAAATALVSSWSTGNKVAALTVATPAAVTALFAAPYTSGLAIDRGCSTTFIPIVCTFGPPGGASPSDPIYEVIVSQVDDGWYVSSVNIEN